MRLGFPPPPRSGKTPGGGQTHPHTPSPTAQPRHRPAGWAAVPRGLRGSAAAERRWGGGRRAPLPDGAGRWAAGGGGGRAGKGVGGCARPRRAARRLRGAPGADPPPSHPPPVGRAGSAGWVAAGLRAGRPRSRRGARAGVAGAAVWQRSGRGAGRGLRERLGTGQPLCMGPGGGGFPRCSSSALAFLPFDSF